MGQDGQVYRMHGAWYVRYYQNELQPDGSTVRKRKCQRLCAEKDSHGKRYKSEHVKSLAQEFMAGVNKLESAKRLPAGQVTICTFYDTVFLPYIRTSYRKSTVESYEQIFEQYLRGHFGNKTLGEYTLTDAFDFISALRYLKMKSGATLGKRTIQHVKNLGSAIFEHAKESGRVKTNPFAVNIKKILLGMQVGKMKSYTLAEIEDIISALASRVDCQLVMAFGFFLGMRPSEVFGLRWEDFGERLATDGTKAFREKTVSIRRAVVRGEVGETKNPWSAATLPIVDDRVLVPLALWFERCGKPTDGWVFGNGNDKPVDRRDLARKIIIPLLKSAGLTWKGYHASRRGAGTVLIALDGEKGTVAAQGLLRHKSLSTTLNYYKDETPEVTADGLRTLAGTTTRKALPNGGDYGNRN